MRFKKTSILYALLVLICGDMQVWGSIDEEDMVASWNPILDECNSITIDCEPIPITSETPHDARRDATKLYEHLYSIGEQRTSIESLLIEIISQRTLAERLEIVEAYNNAYESDLLPMLHNTLSGLFRTFVKAMLTPLAKFYAQELANSISSSHPRCGTMIEILGALSNAGMRAVYASYDEREIQWDPHTYIYLLADRSFLHIVKVLDKYHDINPMPLASRLPKGFKKQFLNAVTGLIDIARHRSKFFAQRIRKDLKSAILASSHGTLIRIIATRAEIDFCSIAVAYEAMYRTGPLIDVIKKMRSIPRNVKEAFAKLFAGKCKKPKPENE